jgi:hypothetical protein
MSNNHKKIEEFMKREIGHEVTHEEALLFLSCCPYGEEIGKALMLHYSVSYLQCGDSYQALQNTIIVFVDAVIDCQR